MDENHTLIPISIGELFDKISILEIKLLNIADLNKVENINKEFDILKKHPTYIQNFKLIQSEYTKLFEINSLIWRLEDEIRLILKTDFSKDNYIHISKQIHSSNETRSVIKKNINTRLNSSIVEEKSYS